MSIERVENIIIGAGIAGLGAAYEFHRNNRPCVILERSDSYGGLLNNFSINGFRFDKFIHLSFTNNKTVRDVFDKTPSIIHQPRPYNYYKGHWLKHPAQNNLFPLPSEEKRLIINDFRGRLLKAPDEIIDYEEWLRVQYGDYFADNFPLVYTKKYWTVEAKSLETKWVGSRMYKPSIEEVIYGAKTEKTPNTYYAKEMRYPKTGGYKEFLSPLIEGIDIRYNQNVVSIDTNKKLIETKDGKIYAYCNIINTVPLPELMRFLKGVPAEVLKASKNLRYTSGAIISLGFNRVDLADKLWYYIYDEDVPPARVYSPSMKSPDNCPKGCSSIQAEYYFDWKDGISTYAVLQRTIEKFIDMNLFSEQDLIVKDIRIEKYANVIFDHDIYRNRECILRFINEQGMFSAGRFGEWDYYWSDQSFMSGLNAANRIVS